MDSLSFSTHQFFCSEESKFEKKAQAPVDDISDAVNEFIKNFGKQEDKKAVKVQNIHPVQTTVHSTKIASKTPHKPHTRVETPKKKAEPKPAPKKQEAPTTEENTGFFKEVTTRFHHNKIPL